MKRQRKTDHLFFTALLGGSLLALACGGEASGGPTVVNLRDAGTGGSPMGAGGSGGSPAGTGGDSSGGSDAGDEASISPVDGGAGGSPTSDAPSDEGCPTPVTFDDYLNACSPPQVTACPLSFATTLPNPLPPLP